MHVCPESSCFISNLLQEKIYHRFLSKRCCPHERRKAPFILLAEQRTVCKIIVISRKSYNLMPEKFCTVSHYLVCSSPLLRCAATCETSPWAANWCMDRADGKSLDNLICSRQWKYHDCLSDTLILLVLCHKSIFGSTYSLMLLGVL